VIVAKTSLAALALLPILLLNFAPLVAAIVLARYNWRAIRLQPRRWALQLLPLLFTLAALLITVTNRCQHLGATPQPLCPEALTWAPRTFSALFGGQVLAALFAGLRSPRRLACGLFQALSVFHGAYIMFGGVLEVSGQWL
jgi:hypothetical protein